MGLLDHLSNLRYTRAVERFSQIGGRVNAGRAGAIGTAAAASGRAASHADGGAGSEGNGASPEGGGGGVLATVAAGVSAAIGLEMAFTAALGDLADSLGLPSFPGMPALRMWDLDVGLPHAHNHPPNLTPPNPVPLPLPSMGPIIPIPILSGASTVVINGRAAARCGDMGLGIWCGGYFPMFEIFLGSSSVWIESARAARLAVDITKHCTFSSPKPNDPPMGPMIGTTVGPGSGDVLIGGIPFPSLFSLAIAQAFKALFKVGGAVFRRLSAARYVRNLRNIHINGHGAPTGWADDVTKDLERMARTRSGREALERIERAGHPVTIVPHNSPTNPLNAVADHHGNWDAFLDPATGLHMPGAPTTVGHTPSNWANHPNNPWAAAGQAHPAPGTSSDAILFHEMNHAGNHSDGASRQLSTNSEHGWDSRWSNHEEYSTVAAENGYRTETGLPTRSSYTSPFP